nr:DUF6303 family protein [Streptomyces sp. NBC_00830]
MRKTFRAQMTNSAGSWHLYVPLFNRRATQWPEYDWHRTAPAPTLTERERALNGLGYDVPVGAEWSWTEDSDIPGDPASPVRLIATVTVRPTAGGGAR